MDKLHQALTTWYYVLMICYPVSTVFMLIRLTHRYQRGSFKQSDIVACLALLASTLFFLCSLWLSGLLYGLHSSKAGLFAPRMSIYLYEMTKAAGTPLSKASVIVLLFEIQPTGWLRAYLYALLSFIVLQIIAGEAVSIFTCVAEPTRFWAILDQHRLPFDLDSGHAPRCVKTAHSFIFNATANTISEVSTIILAGVLVGRIRASVMQKAGLVFTFLLGVITIGASIAATVYSTRGYKAAQNVADIPEAIRLFFTANMWTTIEVNSAVFIAALLPLRGPIARLYATLTSRCTLPKVYESDGSDRVNMTEVTVESQLGAIESQAEKDAKVITRLQESGYVHL